MDEIDLEKELYEVGYALLISATAEERNTAFRRMIDRGLILRSHPRSITGPVDLEQELEEDAAAASAEAHVHAQNDLAGGKREAMGVWAREYMGAELGKLRAAICPERERYLGALSSDKTQLTTVVADICAGIFIGVPPATVAALVLKVGIRRICEERNPFRPVAPPSVQQLSLSKRVLLLIRRALTPH